MRELFARPAWLPPARLCTTVTAALMLALAASECRAAAAEPTDAYALPQLLGLQATAIAQRINPMHSPYEGDNSLPGSGEHALTHSYIASFGAALRPGMQAYVDLRLQRGTAINNGHGLAGFVNGDFASGAAQSAPYVYRAYLRYYLAQGNQRKQIDKSMDNLKDAQPIERLEFKIGRMLPTDDFDKNRYMDNPATQFFNLGLVNNPAWDYAQNDRGVTDGVAVGLHRANWSLKAGTYRMPSTAGGPDLEAGAHARNDNLELVLRTAPGGVVLRLLAFQNHARMGNYAEAVAASLASGATPDIGSTRRAWRRKTGFGMSFELPLADDGNSGLFACAARNDGKTEDFSFTEADSNLCIGGQISGARWKRSEDRLGIGLLFNGVSASHRDYLARGGVGIQVGDGRLNYGQERVLEAYYLLQLNKRLTISPDLQWVQNPGYNRDRGPAVVFGVRLTFSY